MIDAVTENGRGRQPQLPVMRYGTTKEEGQRLQLMAIPKPSNIRFTQQYFRQQ